MFHLVPKLRVWERPLADETLFHGGGGLTNQDTCHTPVETRHCRHRNRSQALSLGTRRAGSARCRPVSYPDHLTATLQSRSSEVITMRPIFVSIASAIALAAVFAAAAGAFVAEDPVLGAEARLLAEVRRMYGEAQTLLNRADYPAAEKGFFDCVALCQAAEPQVRDAAPLRLVSQGCLAAIDKLGQTKRRNETLGEWKRRCAAFGSAALAQWHRLRHGVPRQRRRSRRQLPRADRPADLLPHRHPRHHPRRRPPRPSRNPPPHRLRQTRPSRPTPKQNQP